MQSYLTNTRLNSCFPYFDRMVRALSMLRFGVRVLGLNLNDGEIC